MKKMKKLFFILSLTIPVVMIGCSETNNTTEKTVTTKIEVMQEPTNQPVVEDVDVAKFKELIASEKGLVIDVRTPEEWATGVIEGAIQINFFNPAFETEINKLDKNKEIYVYCKAGGRSTKAAKKIEALGFKKVCNLLGGIGGWISAGNEVVK